MNGGYGAVTWWGFSPMTDLLQQEGEDLVENILLVGAADIRNILKAASSRKPNNKEKLNIFVIENSLEVIARHILLLVLCCEDQSQIGLQEKCEYFMEIFGNSFIRSQTDLYIRETSKKLIKFVTSLQGENYPFIDVSLLKFKERDGLEDIFKFWRDGRKNDFDIGTHWEQRLRQSLSTRYDSRTNIYDWDYNMKLKEKASIVSFKEYKEWRENGIAFQMRDITAYNTSNRTLVSRIPVKINGNKIYRQGYWGDMLNSPFVSYGVDCDDSKQLKKANGKHEKTATDVTCYNLTKLIKSINGEVEDEKISAVNDDDHQKSTSKGSNLNNVCVTFLPLNCFEDIIKKSKYNNHFDVVYFSNSMVHHLAKDFQHTLKDSASVAVESTKFMLDLRPEMHKDYVQKITAMASKNNLQVMSKNSKEQEAIMRFQYQK